MELIDALSPADLRKFSTNDQQTPPMQSRALREYAVLRGWTITVHIRGIQQFAQEHFDFAPLGELAIELRD